MGALFVFILIILLSAFFGLENFVVNGLGSADIQILGVSVLSDGFRAVLAMGIVFCELAVIAFYMLDRVSDAIRDIIKPLIRLIPLSLFVTTSYNTLSPIVFSLLPATVSNAFGVTQSFQFTAAVHNSSFSEGILTTVATMILFLITTTALSDRKESVRVKQLEAQVKYYKGLALK